MQNEDVTEQRIRELAYHLWETNGKPEGSANRYWDQAEAQLWERQNQRSLDLLRLQRYGSPPNRDRHA